MISRSIVVRSVSNLTGAEKLRRIEGIGRPITMAGSAGSITKDWCGSVSLRHVSDTNRSCEAKRKKTERIRLLSSFMPRDPAPGLEVVVAI